MCVEFCDPLALVGIDCQALAVLAQVCDFCRCYHFIRVGILRQLSLQSDAVLIRRLLYCFTKLRYGPDFCFVQVRDETGVNDGPVLVCHVHACRKVTHGTRPAGSEQGQRRPKQEERDVLRGVKVQDLGEDAEGWVVNHHILRPILFGLIVSARIERTDEVLPVDLVLLGHPVRDSIVHDVRRVAVVGRLFGLELVQEVVVLVVAFFAAVVVPVVTVEPLVLLPWLQRFEAVALQVHQREALHLDLELLRVPRCKLGDLIVREPERPDLFFVQVVGVYHRHRLQPELLGCFQPCMAGHDDAVLVGHDRNLEAEVPDAVRDGIHRAVVEPRVHRVGC